jgi:hypothetical protein
MSEHRTWTEEIDIAGRDLVDCVTRVIREGNVRRVILRDAAGVVLLELPLAAGVAVGGVVVLAVPVVAALGAMAALLTNCRLQIVRAEDPVATDTKPGDTPTVQDPPTPAA